MRIARSQEFINWTGRLRDLKARIAIDRRLDRVREGNFGDIRPVGEGVSELRIDVGPGYRLYFVKVGETIVVLLCAGDKSSQSRDIALAKKMAPRAEEIANAAGI